MIENVEGGGGLSGKGSELKWSDQGPMRSLRLGSDHCTALSITAALASLQKHPLAILDPWILGFKVNKGL